MPLETLIQYDYELIMPQ